MIATFQAQMLRRIIKEPARRIAWRGNQFGISTLVIRAGIINRTAWVARIQRVPFD